MRAPSNTSSGSSPRARGLAPRTPRAVEQDLLLDGLVDHADRFFGMLFDHTMEGVYSHPVYGGNKDYVGWDSVCYEGDVHGVRFPGGEDASADAEPWRKFGGYAPDEMIAPGACPTGKSK